MAPTTLDQRITSLEARLRRSNILMCGMVSVFVGVMVMGMGEPTTQPSDGGVPPLLKRPTEPKQAIPNADKVLAYGMVVTQFLSVVNDDGKSVAQIYPGRNGGGLLKLFDGNGNVRCIINESQMTMVSSPMSAPPTVLKPQGYEEVAVSEFVADPSGAKAMFDVVPKGVFDRRLSGEFQEGDIRESVGHISMIGRQNIINPATARSEWSAVLDLRTNTDGPRVKADVLLGDASLSLYDNKGNNRACLGSMELSTGQSKIKHPESSLLLFDPYGNVISSLP